MHLHLSNKFLLNISRSIKFISHGQKVINFLQAQFELTFQKIFSSHLFASEASRCLHWNVSEVARSTVERATAGVRGHSHRKFRGFLPVKYSGDAILQ